MKKPSFVVDDNWLSEKVIEITCMMKEIMNDKNRTFKHFCESLNPTEIKLKTWAHKLFFGEEELGHKNKYKHKSR
jgi:hypothetical protein